MPSRTYRDLGYVTVRLRHVWSTDLDRKLNALAEQKHVGLAQLVDVLLSRHFDSDELKSDRAAAEAFAADKARNGDDSFRIPE